MTAAVSDPRGGVCPTCHNSDGYVNVGKNHYGLCREHGVFWYIGYGLFSCWQDETEEHWQANRDLLAGMTRVRSATLTAEECIP